MFCYFEMCLYMWQPDLSVTHPTKARSYHCPFLTLYKQSPCVQDSCCRERISIDITEEFWGLVTWCCYSEDAKCWAAWQSRQHHSAKNKQPTTVPGLLPSARPMRRWGIFRLLSRGSLELFWLFYWGCFFSSPQK